MTEDFCNGLPVLPLMGSHSIVSRIAISDAHPWRELYQERVPPPDSTPKAPLTTQPPLVYKHDEQLIAPPPATSPLHAYGKQNREVELHETVRLCDVEAFRKCTAEKVQLNGGRNHVNGLIAGISRLSTSSPSTRPVIYRFIDVIKSSVAVLEAIHFELFMPDRPDLRFLGLPFSSVPAGTVEGDYFHVKETGLLEKPSFALSEYPVLWEATHCETMEFPSRSEQHGLAYVVKKTRGGSEAISEICDRDFFVRDTLFRSGEGVRKEHSLIRVAMREMGTAHLHPVEPPRPSPPPSLPGRDEAIAHLERLSAYDRAAVYKAFIQVAPPRNDAYVLTTLKGHAGNSRLRKALSALDGSKAGSEDPRSDYVKRVGDVHTTSQRAGRVASAARTLSAAEAERIADRLKAFKSYGEEGDLKLMDELFRLGSRYRMVASQGADARDLEMKIDESVVLQTITDEKMGKLETARPLLDCIYGRGEGETVEEEISEKVESIHFNGMQLNEAQSRAIRMYADEEGPRVFCILSPPGSGKTTIAAAMASTVARSQYPDLGFDVNADYYDAGGDAQLLLSVQNVAVDNIGAALKKMWRGEVIIYNMKSNKKLDPKCPAPFDFFDKMKKEELEQWKNGRQPMEKKVIRGDPFSENAHEETVRFANYEECLTFCRREKEKKLYPKIILSTVEMVLQKMYTSSKLCEDLRRVRRIVIDESSLLTEAALYAIIRRFPRARIVLIGDDKQLPPFMYDQSILGHELAGRPALSVAMKTGRVPVVELNEVYRASPSLAEPYNRLAYDGKLVSRKPEGETPLTTIGFVQPGAPQLLLIDVDGVEQKSDRSTSLYNEKEMQVLVRFLSNCPADWAKDIMIICLYKDQKWRLQEMLNRQNRQNQYTVLTVDSAQGKEAPIVILMTTRTQRATDFFCSPERCNVAVSRQQLSLVILGKSDLLSSTYPWSAVVNGGDFTRIKAD